MNEYEWVFGPTKAAVVCSVLRWGKSGIGCEFYDWAKHDPLMHELFFLDRDADRDFMIKKGVWSEKDEMDFRTDCARRSSKTYRGWWRFCNVPNGYSANEWLNGGQGHEELIDPHMDPRKLQPPCRSKYSMIGDNLIFGSSNRTMVKVSTKS